MTCPPIEEILRFIQGSLEPNSKAVLGAHFATGCRPCVESRRWINELLSVTARDDSFDFNEETIEWSVAQFKAMSGITALRKRLWARLIFDNLMPRQALEVRTTAPPTSGRQMLFRAESYDVDLRIELVEESATTLMIGQILNAARHQADLVGIRVRLVPHDAERARDQEHQAETDSHGMFRLRGITAGSYDLNIKTSDGDIWIDAITCGVE